MLTRCIWHQHQRMILLVYVSACISSILFTYDSLLQVFAVNEEKDGVQVTPEAHFKQHRGRVLAVCWGYEDTDVLISGAEDRFIYLWKWTDYLYPKGK